MAELVLFNTLGRKLEPFRPCVPGEARIYICGPTVYNQIHIGNLRTFLWGDLLRRYLEFRGLRVTQVMNITDVEDKIIRKAAEAGKDIYAYVEPYIASFHESLKALRIRNVRRSTPRGTSCLITSSGEPSGSSASAGSNPAT